MPTSDQFKQTSLSLRTRLNENVYSPRMDVVLCLIGFASSMTDTVTITTLRVSVAHNTLNILLIAMGAVGVQKDFPAVIPERAAVVLAAFGIGSFLSGRLSRWLGVKKRGPLFYNFALQAGLIYFTAILLYTNVISMTNDTNYALIAILALVFGTQFASNRLLNMLGCEVIAGQEVSAAMSDLLTDEKLFHGFTSPGTRNRNCRASFLASFFSGGIVGGLMSVYDVNPACILFLVATIKFIAASLILFLPAEAILGTLVNNDSVVTLTPVNDDDDEGEQVGRSDIDVEKANNLKVEASESDITESKFPSSSKWVRITSKPVE